MSKDKLKLYILEFVLLTILFFTLFVSSIYRTIYLSVFLLIYMLILRSIIKKRSIASYLKKEVAVLMSVFAIIYLAVFYLLGMHFGFYKSSTVFSLNTIKYFILPLSIIIYTSESIREVLLSQKGKLPKVVALIATIFIDLIIYTEVYNVFKLDDFLMILGFILFASISCNLLYNYVSIRFGKLGIIIFRLVTVLYPYVIPLIPNVYIFFRSFLRILYPYFIYLFLENTYSKSNFAVAYKDKRKEVLGTTILIIVLSSIIMLISCEFKYGILVVGSGSMTGTLNIGDATIFESFSNQMKIKKGDIIIFEKNKLQVIHRVVEIKNINGTIRYYTKGDANKARDKGYVTSKDIKGISKLRIKYIGYPTIWVKEIFE